MNPKAAFLGGLLGAGIVVGILAWRKAQDLEAQGAALRQRLLTDGTRLEAAFTSLAPTLYTEMGVLGRQTALEVAPPAAATTLRTVYALTPENMASFAALARRIGL